MDTGERIALAILNGEVSMADAREELHLATVRKEVERNAEALRKFRNGEPVWAWPQTAPWAGF